MDKILDVTPWTLYDATTIDATEFMELLFWIDKFNLSAIIYFQDINSFKMIHFHVITLIISFSNATYF